MNGGPPWLTLFCKGDQHRALQQPPLAGGGGGARRAARGRHGGPAGFRRPSGVCSYQITLRWNGVTSTDPGLLPDLEWVELSPAVVERSTLLGVEHNLRTSDSLQAFSCLQLGADAVMVTGDAGFQRVPALRQKLVNGDEGGD